MKRLVVSLFVMACAVQCVHADDTIQSTVRNRAIRKARALRVKKARDAETDRFVERANYNAELMRRRIMENERHAAEMQHAINGHNSNVVQAQRNAVEAERNRVLNNALMRARGFTVCERCGSTGHSNCAGPTQYYQPY